MKLSTPVLLTCGLVTALSVAGCTSGGSDGTPASSSAVATVTTTAPATATGAPVTGTPTSGATGSGGGTGGSGGSSGGNASGPGLCTPTVMTFAVGRTDGAAGTSYFTVTATNASQQPCVTTGYPGVAFLNASNQQVLQATRQTGKTVATLVLAPGEQAHAVIAAAAMGNGGAACPTSPAFLFTLPDNTDSTKLTHTTPICGVSVEPFVKGTG